ncbi:MAG: hypothetical protein IM526_02565 [Microcystis sp. M38BS1]|uniref:hypothetical protein n=1 Tax=Microcystis sp. M38BS1 TaxID=2771188 RepID=UPI0031FE30A2|nr:hypothetical protein [Microcystis sp. M38BS1]MCA6582542.1 hypothetical protein [Pseudanabaena sp. M34BS1SP1A06MG]
MPNRYISLLTEGESYFPETRTFDFGNTGDGIDKNVFQEINGLNIEVDKIVSLLEFLFCQCSDSQQLDMFSRFLTAHTGHSKYYTHFWEE